MRPDDAGALGWWQTLAYGYHLMAASKSCGFILLSPVRHAPIERRWPLPCQSVPVSLAGAARGLCQCLIRSFCPARVLRVGAWVQFSLASNLLAGRIHRVKTLALKHPAVFQEYAPGPKMPLCAVVCHVLGCVALFLTKVVGCGEFFCSHFLSPLFALRYCFGLGSLWHRINHCQALLQIYLWPAINRTLSG